MGKTVNFDGFAGPHAALAHAPTGVSRDVPAMAEATREVMESSPSEVLVWVRSSRYGRAAAEVGTAGQSTTPGFDGATHEVSDGLLATAAVLPQTDVIELVPWYELSPARL